MSQRAEDNPNVSPSHAIADVRKLALLARLPFLLCELCTLWGMSSRLRKRSAEIRA